MQNFDDLLERYEITKRSNGSSEHTIERVKLTVRMVIRDMCIKNLDELTTDVLLDWGSRKRQGDFGKPLSPSGLYACYNSLKSFIKFLEQSHIETNINKSQLYCRPVYKRRKALRADDVSKIVTYAKHEDIAVLARLLFTTGMRLSEALKLRDSDIPAGNEMVIENTKGGKSRPVFINDGLKQDMLSLHADSGYVFRDHKQPYRPLSRKQAYYYLKKIYTKAGYGNYSPHEERHGFATELLARGVSLPQVSRMMGHSDFSTTQIYEHLITDDLWEAHRQYMPII